MTEERDARLRAYAEQDARVEAAVLGEWQHASAPELLQELIKTRKTLEVFALHVGRENDKLLASN